MSEILEYAGIKDHPDNLISIRWEHFVELKKCVDANEALLSENQRLRKIAAYVPPMIYIEAKERAGFGVEIKESE